MHKNVNNIVKTKFWFDEYNGSFGKRVETEIIKIICFHKQSSNKQPRSWKLIKPATLGTQIFINDYYLKLLAFTYCKNLFSFKNSDLFIPS